MGSRPYELARLRKLALFVTGRTVLDIGYAELPNPYLAGHRVGYDLQVPTLACGYEEKITSDVQQIAEALKGRKFDTIVCGELIEHVENPYALLRDLHGLLEDRGTLIVTTPNPLGFPVIVLELLQIKRFFYTTDHRHYFLPRWVDRMLSATGFASPRKSAAGLWLPYGRLPVWPTILSYQLIYITRKSGHR